MHLTVLFQLTFLSQLAKEFFPVGANQRQHRGQFRIVSCCFHDLIQLQGTTNCRTSESSFLKRTLCRDFTLPFQGSLSLGNKNVGKTGRRRHIVSLLPSIILKKPLFQIYLGPSILLSQSQKHCKNQAPDRECYLEAWKGQYGRAKKKREKQDCLNFCQKAG